MVDHRQWWRADENFYRGVTQVSKTCDHDKVYAPYVLTSNPPQYPWVCRKCKAIGVDRGTYVDAGEYTRLIQESGEHA